MYEYSREFESPINLSTPINKQSDLKRWENDLDFSRFTGLFWISNSLALLTLTQVRILLPAFDDWFELCPQVGNVERLFVNDCRRSMS